MGEVGWFLSATALIVLLLGGGFLVSMFVWFVHHDGDVEVKGPSHSTLRMLVPVAGLVCVAGLLAGFLRLVRPYLH